MGRTSDARERLVASGSELMHERGYTAVGVSEVCSAAEVKKGSFYHFFPSKLDLALAVLDSLQESTSGPLEALAANGASPLERLSTYLDAVYVLHAEMHRSHGKVLGCPFGNMALEMSIQEPKLRDRLRNIFAANVRVIEDVVREAVARGDLGSLDPHRAARSVLALIEGSVMQAKMDDDPEILRGLREDVSRLLGVAS